MGKMLEKALKDAAKEGACRLGAKSVLSSLGGSKLVVASASLQRLPRRQDVEGRAAAAGVPLVRFPGSSVALGRACGLQFRVSAVSLTSATDAGVKSIINENGQQ